jgi:hypothetical protein
MKAKNYKTIENRPELTNEQIMAGMNFANAASLAPIDKRIPFSTLIIGGLMSVLIVFGMFVFFSNKTTHSIQNNRIIVDSVAKVFPVPTIDSMPRIKIPVVQPQRSQAISDTV